MIPLEVTAHLRGAVCLPNGPIALDGLLASSVALRDGLPPALDEGGILPIEIPLQREQAGRFHLASVSHCEVDESELRWVNRRFPIPEAQAMGSSSINRIRIDAGRCKSYRIPLGTFHAKDDRLLWWCIGDQLEIQRLLELVGYIGKKRGVGLGAVTSWQVEEVAGWNGFPVLRDGLPLRPLPLDWPGLAASAERGMACLTYPYWRRSSEEPCATP